jgi:predicted ribosomally synthesized peptide with nif11-like leader
MQTAHHAVPVSLAALQSFLAKVSDDEALRDKLHAASGLDDVVALAADHGHSLDKTVVLKEQAKALSTAKDHELAAINSWGDALMHCFGATDAE